MSASMNWTLNFLRSLKKSNSRSRVVNDVGGVEPLLRNAVDDKFSDVLTNKGPDIEQSAASLQLRYNLSIQWMLRDIWGVKSHQDQYMDTLGLPRPFHARGRVGLN